MAKKTHGKTASGVPITDDLVAELAAKAEAGYDVDECCVAEAAAHRSALPPRASSPSGWTPSCVKRCPAGTAGPRDDLVSDPQGAAQVPGFRLTWRGRARMGRRPGMASDRGAGAGWFRLPGQGVVRNREERVAAATENADLNPPDSALWNVDHR